MRTAKWSPFRTTTPHGRYLEGQICATHNAGTLAGALMIEWIDGQPCGRIMLYGMPEIPYYYEGRVHTNGALSVTVSRKLDGTAIIFSALFWNGEYLETICRTRGVPVLVNMRPPKNRADSSAIGDAMAAQRYRQWVDLVGRVADLEAIEGLCQSQQATLVFELYGKENPHCVDYDTDLAMRLHTMLRGKKVMPYQELQAHANRWGLRLAEQMEPIGGGWFSREEPVLLDQIKALEEALEAWNDPATGTFREEGLVISINRRRSATLYKAKPASMAEYFRVTGEVTPMTVRHELHKLTEMGLPTDYETAMAYLRQVFGEEAASVHQALLEREFWAWWRATK